MAVEDEKQNKLRERKRNQAILAHKVAKIDDEKRLTQEMRGLKHGQKSKILRKRAKLRAKADKKAKLTSQDMKPIPQEYADAKKNSHDYAKKYSNSKVGDNNDLFDKYRTPEDIEEAEKKEADSQRLADKQTLSIKKSIMRNISVLKIKNRIKKNMKSVRFWIVSGIGFNIVLICIIGTIIMGLIFSGGIVAIMLSHPTAIKEIYKYKSLGDVTNIANVKEDVKVDGKVIAKGNKYATSGNFTWYGSGTDDKFEATESKAKESSSGALTGKTNADKTFNKLSKEGFSTATASGIMGNFMQESGLNPKSVQSSGLGRGLAQWSEGERWSTLQAWAKGRDIWALDTQLDFVIHELETQYHYGLFKSVYSSYGKNFKTGKEAYAGFKKETDPETAMYVFEKVYERAGSPAYAQRIKFTNEFYAKYK